MLCVFKKYVILQRFKNDPNSPGGEIGRHATLRG